MRTLRATVTVLSLAVLSWLIYELSPDISSHPTQELVAKLSGGAYFLAVAFGGFYVYLIAALDEAPFGYSVIAALTTPFLWMTKECVRPLESHPLIECLYYYVNPLNLWLLLLVVLEMGVATLVVRRLRSARGEQTRVLAPAPLATIAVSLSFFIGLYWEGSGGARELDPTRYTGSGPSDREVDLVDEAVPNGRRPDIVFILGDNHNAATMGNAGHPVIETPALDRLAREGVRFDNAFNTTSLCSPSRASILTGTYAHRHGVKNNHTPWTGEMPTFLEQLSDAGYATAFIGKWHMPGHGLPEMLTQLLNCAERLIRKLVEAKKGRLYSLSAPTL